MSQDFRIRRAVKRAIYSHRLAVAALGLGGLAPAFAQDAPAPAPAAEVVVTGSRIIRQDFEANSPITTVSQDALVNQGDVTLESALNTLPHIIAGATAQSNNPSNDGQANIDLRGLGANRNLVLVDGRRPMVSSNDLTVDVNTIPAALIESVEVITGGAGAVYGADAVAGVVNVKLKRNFEGFNLSGSYSDSTQRDAANYSVSAVLGGNFAEGRGNAVFAYDRTSRQSLIKGQRDFAKVATATTGTPPEGVLRFANSNRVSQAAVDQVFAQYGVAPGAAEARAGKIGFNQDGTLFAVGTFNSPLQVQNFRDDAGIGINERFFPDVYSYNFDAVNLLTLPLDRNNFMTNLSYEVGGGIELFGQGGYTNYEADTGLAPSPVPGVVFASAGLQDPGSEVGSALITPGATACVNGAGTQVRCTLGIGAGIPVPVSNPFVQALPDLLTLLNSRTGNDPALVGSGATEPFLVAFRPVAAGLRQQSFENTVVSYLGGVRGPIFSSGWRFEAYFSSGTTEISNTQLGNIDTQKVTDLLAAADGGASQCEGGFNVFGNNKISQDCLDFVKVATFTKLEMEQRVGQAYVTGNLGELPAGPVSAVVGGEWRGFDYAFDPGTGAGPVSGFNTQDPEAGSNEFRDVFAELAVPLMRDSRAAQALDLTLGYRFSRSQFTDDLENFTAEAAHSNSFKAELNWKPVDLLRVRTSYQRSARAPNFAELFQGGGNFPQIIDPCSNTSAARNGPNGAQVTALCAATGVPGVGAFVATPGLQAGLDTAGNANLKPEKADTLTFGVVFGAPSQSRWAERLRSSVDFWKIKITDAIVSPDPNVGIAKCYNFYGTNATFDPNDPYCQNVAEGRAAGGGNIAGLVDLANDPENGLFASLNSGTIDTSGLDLQLDWGFDLEWVGLPASAGSISTNLMATRLFEYNLEDTPGVAAIDYAGTINYFGGGISLGQTLPKWKAALNTTWSFGKFALATRARYIDGMENRGSVQFPGETFTGVGSVTYWDVAAAWRFMDKSELRIGLDNAFDKQPPSYAPNIQSGTDPSTYDVIGRVAFARVVMQF